MMCLIMAAKTSFAGANDLTVYDKPEAGAKIATTIKNDQAIIPIFTPKDGKWVKIANPQNGDTGWVRAEQIKGPKTITTMTIGTNKDQNSTTVESYKLVERGQVRSLNDKEVAQAAKQMTEADLKMKQSIQKMQAQMRANMAEIFKEFDHDFQDVIMMNKK